MWQPLTHGAGVGANFSQSVTTGNGICWRKMGVLLLGDERMEDKRMEAGGVNAHAPLSGGGSLMGTMKTFLES